MFSGRTPAELARNRLAEARERLRPRYDLTVSNPTAAGVRYPEDLLAPLADPAGLSYRPDPRGLATARAAVAVEYARMGAEVDPDRLLLTASTSEAYTFLFKLLADPGEAVLVPSPSYPLFEHLAALEAVRPLAYRLHPELGWSMEISELAAAPETVRAVIVVHPNNPTGSLIDANEGRALDRLAAERGWAVIADEVFLDYPLSGPPGASFAAGRPAALTFALGGLSKSVGLPQVKLGWIAAGGPPPLVAAALDRLELIADTFLSVSTPVQLAAPALLQRGAAVRAAITDRCRSNLTLLRSALAARPELSLLEPEGGWSAVVRFPDLIDEEELALELLELDGVAVHPGYFFDFPLDGVLVVSLLTPPEVLAAGIGRIMERIAGHVAAAGGDA